MSDMEQRLTVAEPLVFGGYLWTLKLLNNLRPTPSRLIWGTQTCDMMCGFLMSWKDLAACDLLYIFLLPVPKYLAIIC